MEHALLGSIGARDGHFLLESGHHGRLWLDLDALFVRPDRIRPFADELADRFAALRPSVVCGPLVGGAFLAQMMAAALGAEFVFAERIAGPPVAYRVPSALRPGLADRAVAVVDDAINAGSAVRGTIADLEACGARVVAVGALLVLGATGQDAIAARGLPLESLLALPNELWDPTACPFCAAGVPLDVPDDVRFVR
jgi:orotate phosphoribosyltransferase